MISFKHKGDFSKTYNYLQKVKRKNQRVSLEKYAKEGVIALASVTPVDTGQTANSWSYVIESTNNQVKISFINTNIQNGIPIAILLQYGHGTRNGGWVQGRDYINPAIQPIFDKIAQDAWKEVTKL